MAKYDVSRDPCEILGINWQDLDGKPIEEIRLDVSKAARPLIRNLHPDHNPEKANDDKAVREFREVMEAKRLLSDEAACAPYLADKKAGRSFVSTPRTSSSEPEDWYDPDLSPEENWERINQMYAQSVNNIFRDLHEGLERARIERERQEDQEFSGLALKLIHLHRWYKSHKRKRAHENRVREQYKQDSKPRNGINDARINVLISRAERGDAESLREVLDTTDFNSPKGIKVIGALYQAQLLSGSMDQMFMMSFGPQKIGDSKYALEIAQKLDMKTRLGQKAALFFVRSGLAKPSDHGYGFIGFAFDGFDSDLFGTAKQEKPKDVLSELISKTNFNSPFGVELTQALLDAGTFEEGAGRAALRKILKKTSMKKGTSGREVGLILKRAGLVDNFGNVAHHSSASLLHGMGFNDVFRGRGI